MPSLVQISLVVTAVLSMAGSVAAHPAASQTRQVKASGNARALYFITNDQDNAVAAVEVGNDGLLNGKGSKTLTGGNGASGLDAKTKEKAAPDSLFSQSSLTVAGNHIFAVNAGSNSLSMLRIDKANPLNLTVIGKPLSLPGEFPNTVAASKKHRLVCVGMTGKKAGISCSNFSNRGLDKADDLREIKLDQSTPPLGPTNTVSHVFFSGDERFLHATIKGDPDKKTTGLFSSYEVQNDCGSNSTRVDFKDNNNGRNETKLEFEINDRNNTKVEEKDKSKEQKDKELKEKGQKDKEQKNKDQENKKYNKVQRHKNMNKNIKKDQKNKNNNTRNGILSKPPSLSRLGTSTSLLGTALLFGTTILPQTLDILSTDASFGAALLTGLDANPPKPTVKGKAVLDGQKATCWAAHSAATDTVFVSDVARNRLVELSLKEKDTALKVVGEIDMSATGELGFIDLRAWGDFIYVLSPGNGTGESGIVVVNAKTKKLAQQAGLKGVGAGRNAMGMAAFA